MVQLKLFLPQLNLTAVSTKTTYCIYILTHKNTLSTKRAIISLKITEKVLKVADQVSTTFSPKLSLGFSAILKLNLPCPSMCSAAIIFPRES